MSNVCWLFCCCGACGGYFPSLDLLVWDYLFSVFSWVHLTSLGWNFPSSTFYRTRFVEEYFFNFIMECLFPPPMVIITFAWYSSAHWHPWSLRVCRDSRTSVQALLSWCLHWEVGGYSVCHYVLFGFSPLQLFTLFCTFSLLFLYNKGNFLPGPIYLMFWCSLYVDRHLFLLGLGKFPSMIFLMKTFSMPLTWVSSSIPVIFRLCLFTVSQISWCFILSPLDLTFFWPEYPFLL